MYFAGRRARGRRSERTLQDLVERGAASEEFIYRMARYFPGPGPGRAPGRAPGCRARRVAAVVLDELIGREDVGAHLLARPPTHGHPLSKLGRTRRLTPKKENQEKRKSRTQQG